MRIGTYVVALFSLVGMVSPATAADSPTFNKDVAPIMYRSCVQCHRAGSMAPMSLMTYAEVRPWARAIKQRVVRREMPPWHADPAPGKFLNDISLKPSEIATISAWVDAGAQEGDARDLPAAPTFAEGWSIGKPDLVFKMLEPFEVPADGAVPYLYVTVPTNLKEDVWVRGIELKPSDRRVVHHIIADVVPGDGQPIDPKPRVTRDRGQQGFSGNFAGYVPGRVYDVFEEGVARRIPAGSLIVLQMHYTTIGHPTPDQTEIGVILAKEPPSRLRAGGGGQLPNLTFVIPPGDPNYEVTAQQTFDRDSYLSSVYPHMHVRGKDATYTLIYPDGREEIVLRVPKYDFNWQTSYRLAEPIFMPKGSTLKIVAHFDNSAANKFNPDPRAEVRWGDQTWEEMLIGYFGTVEVKPGAPAPQSDQPRRQP